MLRKLILIGISLASFLALAKPTLGELRSQKRCTPVAGKPNAFDCMVDQADGSVKKTRYFQAVSHKKQPAAPVPEPVPEKASEPASDAGDMQ